MNGNPGSARRVLAPRAPHPATLLLPLLLGACEWFTDFKDQPRLEPWESYSLRPDSASRDTIPFRGQPQYSVPITGTAVAGFQVSYAALPATVDSMSPLPNPTPPSPASLENGRKHYQINCAVCHGLTGAGNGRATLYGLPQISIISAVTQGRTDGYIYGMIRNGRGLMPNYNRIEEMDRWDVVNYVRGLQGRLGAPVDTTIFANPGEGGPKVPGVTRTAPTRPVPFYRAGQALDTVKPAAMREGAPPGAPGAPDSTPRPRARP